MAAGRTGLCYTGWVFDARPKEIATMPSTDPVIVVPGVTATYLRDLYPLPPETIWAVIRKKFDRVPLHPDDTRYEARQPAMVRPGQL